MTRLLVSAAVILTLAAGAAHAAVSVIGGSQAEACARAAFAEQTRASFENICTAALETEMLTPRDRAGTYVNRGVIKLRRTDFIEAAKDFDEAIRMRPEMGEAYVNRGAASIGLRNYAAGLADLDKAIGLGVDQLPKAYYNRALAYEGLDDMKAAYFDYQKALELSPGWDLPKQELSRFSVSRKN